MLFKQISSHLYNSQRKLYTQLIDNTIFIHITSHCYFVTLLLCYLGIGLYMKFHHVESSFSHFWNQAKMVFCHFCRFW